MKSSGRLRQRSTQSRRATASSLLRARRSAKREADDQREDASR